MLRDWAEPYRPGLSLCHLSHSWHGKRGPFRGTVTHNRPSLRLRLTPINRWQKLVSRSRKNEQQLRKLSSTKGFSSSFLLSWKATTAFFVVVTGPFVLEKPGMLSHHSSENSSRSHPLGISPLQNSDSLGHLGSKRHPASEWRRCSADEPPVWVEDSSVGPFRPLSHAFMALEGCRDHGVRLQSPTVPWTTGRDRGGTASN